jgi:hypothetical protein
MLKSHLDAVERHLLQISQIPANAGHTLHRGTPREAFIKTFLIGHLGARLAVGTGEIIDATSQPRQQRNQFDIVIYKSDYPRIDLGGGINAFLAESVVATIEVKSVLTEVELATAIRSASTAKRLTRNLVTTFIAGYVPPGILSYVIAYDGPAQIATVHRWIKSAEAAQNLNQARLPGTRDARVTVVSEGVEGVFVLGRGSIIFDNAPVSLINDAAIAAHPDVRYQILSQQEGNMLWLFLLLTQACSNSTAQWANLSAYLQNVRWQYAGAP